MFDESNSGSKFIVGLKNEAAHILFFFKIHSGHGLIKQQQSRLRSQRPTQLDPLLKTIGQAAHRGFSNRLNLEKINHMLDKLAVLDLFTLRRTDTQCLPKKGLAHMGVAPGHDVVQSAHALEKRDVLKGSGNTAGGGIMRAHLLSRLPLVGDRALLGVIKAVDHVEHGALSGAIGANDRSDFPFANVKTDIHERVHTAKGQ